jgi:hypothetical protein
MKTALHDHHRPAGNRAEKQAPRVIGISVWCQTGGWTPFRRLAYLDDGAVWTEINTFVTLRLFREGNSVEQAIVAYPGCDRNRGAWIELLRLSGVECRIQASGVEVWIDRIAPPSSLQPLPNVPPLRVLIAERHPEIRRCLRRYLEEQGHQVMTAGDWIEVCECLQPSSAVDLALIDICLPGATKSIPLEASTLCVWTLPSETYRHSLCDNAITLAKPYCPEDLMRIWLRTTGANAPTSPDLQKRPNPQIQPHQQLTI